MNDIEKQTWHIKSLRQLYAEVLNTKTINYAGEPYAEPIDEDAIKLIGNHIINEIEWAEIRLQILNREIEDE